MRQLFLFFTALAFFSCHKKDDFSKEPFLFNHHWIGDSLLIIHNGQSSTTYITGQDYLYLGFYANPYTYYISTPATGQVPYNFEFDSPDRIYYWNNGDVKNDHIYSTILKVNDVILQLRNKSLDGSTDTTFYYHAEQ